MRRRSRINNMWRLCCMLLRGIRRSTGKVQIRSCMNRDLSNPSLLRCRIHPRDPNCSGTPGMSNKSNGDKMITIHSHIAYPQRAIWSSVSDITNASPNFHGI